MIKLEGIHAAIMHVAKGHLDDLDRSQMELLQIAIAAYAGLRRYEDVSCGTLLQAVAEAHDQMTQAGLIRRPATKLVDSLRFSDIARRGEAVPTPQVALLRGLMSNLTCMRMADESGRLIEWESGLAPDFQEAVRRLAVAGASSKVTPEA